MRKRFTGLSVLGLSILAATTISLVLDDQKNEVLEKYAKQEVKIPMRDGVHLFTAVYTPRDTSRTYPILLLRTPYSVAPYGLNEAKKTLGPHDGFTREGFIFVYQDVRGRMMSEGEFVNVRPQLTDRKGPQDIDESTDTYDTVDWLLKNTAGNNGRVGIYGISYPGFYAAAGIINSHPAIKAASPQAPIADWFRGDDFHHHGAFYLLDAFDFFSVIGRRNPAPPTTQFADAFQYGVQDSYDFFLRMGPLAEADRKYFKGDVPFWNEAMEHGTYDEFWQKRNLSPHMKGVKAAVMTVGGWFDAEDPYGMTELYRSIEQKNPGIHNSLVIGPWIHGGWSRSEGDRLGNIQFGQKTGHYFNENVDLPFFKHYLKDEGKLDLPEALIFLTGANAWRSFESWPPSGTEARSLYLRDAGKLSFDRPVGGEKESDSYLSDPAKPVPYTQVIQIKRGVEYLVEDQRFAARRPDVLVYESDALAEDLTVVGPVTPELFVSTTGTDADFIVKLIDVFPNDYKEDEEFQKTKPLKVPMAGYQMLVRAEVMRAKFRDDYSQPKAMTPGQVTRIEFQTPHTAHTFKQGHRVMVQIQSSWFPLVDRNPQRFVDIYKADASDFQPATHTIFRSEKHPSRVTVNVLK